MDVLRLLLERQVWEQARGETRWLSVVTEVAQRSVALRFSVPTLAQLSPTSSQMVETRQLRVGPLAQSEETAETQQRQLGTPGHTQELPAQLTAVSVATRALLVETEPTGLHVVALHSRDKAVETGVPQPRPAVIVTTSPYSPTAEAATLRQTQGTEQTVVMETRPG